MVPSAWAVGAHPPALGDPTVDAAAAALRGGNVYIDPVAAGRGVKIGSVSLPADVKLAALPDTGVPASRLAVQLGKALGASATNLMTIAVFTITDDGHAGFGAASSKYCEGYADTQAAQVVAEHDAELANNPDLSALLTDFLDRLAQGPVDSGGTSCDSGGGDGPIDVGAGNGTDSGSGSGGSAWGWIVGLGLVGAGGIGGLAWYSRRARRRALDLARARVQPYYDQLAGELNTLDPKDTATARQALADAAERFTSAGSLLATADSVEKYGIARRTVLEGLYAARTAREALGIDPGPPLPRIDESGYDQLTESQQVSVRGQTFAGYPSYTPGAPYYFGGGAGVPGGWYATPFWETLLLGSVLSGGFGGFGQGTYAGGYDAGYDAGRDAAPDAGAGGDFGAGSDSGGGGDFGGGGDIGGGGGGGDFGGG